MNEVIGTKELAGTTVFVSACVLDSLKSARNVVGVPAEAVERIESSENLLRQLMEIGRKAGEEAETSK